MKKIYKKSLVFCAVLTVCVLASGCGCGKKEKPDDASTKVMEITITPEATPTPAPEQVRSDAVTANGNLTMVNLYTTEGKAENAKSSDGTDAESENGAQDGADGSGENDTTDLTTDTEGAEDGGGE